MRQLIAIIDEPRAPFAELPDAFRTFQQYLLKKPGGNREMVDTLALILQHDEQDVLTWH